MIYGPDLGFVHHVGFGGFATDAVPELIASLRRAGFEHGRVVDAGCGSGILARELEDAGYDVLGIDVSADMIALARVQSPFSDFAVGSIAAVDLPDCIAVFSIGEGLTYLGPDEDAVDFPRLFRRVAGALRSGGLFIFDAVESGSGARMSYVSESAGDGWRVLADVVEDAPRGIVTRHITTERDVEGTVRRSVEEHRVQTVQRAAVQSDLEQAGFSVHLVRQYGAALLPPRRIGFVAALRGASQGTAATLCPMDRERLWRGCRRP